MPLSITSITQPTGCSHRLVTIDHEGVTRTFMSSLEELDALMDNYASPAEAGKALLLLWAAYRRKQGRTIVGVTIA